MLFSIGVKEAIDLYKECLDKVDSPCWMGTDWTEDDVKDALLTAIMAQKLGFTSVQMSMDMINLLALFCEEKVR